MLQSSTVTEEEYQMVREQNERLSIQMEELRVSSQITNPQPNCLLVRAMYYI